MQFEVKPKNSGQDILIPTSQFTELLKKSSTLNCSRFIIFVYRLLDESIASHQLTKDDAQPEAYIHKNF